MVCGSEKKRLRTGHRVDDLVFQMWLESQHEVVL